MTVALQKQSFICAENGRYCVFKNITPGTPIKAGAFGMQSTTPEAPGLCDEGLMPFLPSFLAAKQFKSRIKVVKKSMKVLPFLLPFCFRVTLETKQKTP